MKKFQKSVKIWQSYDREYVAYFFGPPCIFLCRYLEKDDCVSAL